jgi:hypothetical protein
MSGSHYNFAELLLHGGEVVRAERYAKKAHQLVWHKELKPTVIWWLHYASSGRIDPSGVAAVEFFLTPQLSGSFRSRYCRLAEEPY